MPITPSGAQVWRDYSTDGVPASGAHKVYKPQVRAWSQSVEDLVTAAATAALVFDTRANLYAILTAGANTLAWVVSDSTAAYNGIYRKSGASGTGSWARVADLPYSFIVALDAGAGTANAIQATTSMPVSESSLVLLNIFEANTASPVTVSFNGGSALTIKTNSGNDVAAGGLVAGMLVLGRVAGATFRLVSDQISSAIVAQAEAAAAAAEAAQSAAEDAASSFQDPIYTDDRAGTSPIRFSYINRLRGAMPEYFPPAGFDGRLIGTSSSTAAQDNAAFQAALDTGDKVILGSGKTYKLTGVSANDGQSIEGADSGVTVIEIAHESNDIFVAVDNDVSISRVRFKMASGVTRLGGHVVRFGPTEGIAPSGFYHRLSECSFIDLYQPVLINTNNRCDLDLVKFFGCQGYFAKVVGGFNHQLRNIYTLNDPGAQPTYGVYITNVGDLVLSESQLLRAGNCMFWDVIAGGEIASVWITDSFLDSSQRGLWARSTGTGKINRCGVADSWLGGHTNQGALIQQLSTGAIDGIHFDNTDIVLNGEAGIATSGAVRNIRDTNCLIAANGTGVSWGPGANRMSSESYVGASNGLTGNGTGFFVDGTVIDSMIAPKEVGANTTNFVIGANALLPANNNVMKGAFGLRAVNRGSTGFGGASTVNINHGLPFTPNDYDITVRPGVGLASGANPRVTAVTSTQFTVTIDAASSGFVSWEAKIPLFRG